jgi:hypothetical protein
MSSVVTTLSPAQGILQEFPNGNTHTNPHRQSNTNTNANDVRRAAENLNATQTHSQNYGASGLRYHESPNPAKRGHTATPEKSGEVLGQQHNQAFHNNLQHQQQQRPYYESSRHGNTKQPILRSTVSPNHYTNTSYLSPFANTDTMSIAAYEHRPFEGYPTMSMHGDPQEQDDSNMQHTRYPSPGAGLSGHPYNDSVVDQATADMALELQQQQQQQQPQELPQKEESLPPSPGRLRPIPKPEREITKTEEGKYICMWQGCTEDQRLFNRKCEWSKVRLPYLLMR